MTEDFSGANLGLYSITFVTNSSRTAKRCFGIRNFARKPSGRNSSAASKSSTRNVSTGIAPEKLGEFINDNILRTLAGVPESGARSF